VTLLPPEPFIVTVPPAMGAPVAATPEIPPVEELVPPLLLSEPQPNKLARPIPKTIFSFQTPLKSYIRTTRI